MSLEFDTLFGELCLRQGRNLDKDEWESAIGIDSSLRRQCPDWESEKDAAYTSSKSAITPAEGSARSVWAVARWGKLRSGTGLPPITVAGPAAMTPEPAPDPSTAPAGAAAAATPSPGAKAAAKPAPQAQPAAKSAPKQAKETRPSPRRTTGGNNSEEGNQPGWTLIR